MKIFKLVVFLFFVSLSIFAQEKVEKYHRAKIIYNSIENLTKLQKLGVPMDHGMHKMGYSLISDFSDSEIQKARNLGLQVDIEIDDVQKFYVEQNKSKKQRIASPQNVSCNGTATVSPTLYVSSASLTSFGSVLATTTSPTILNFSVSGLFFNNYWLEMLI